MLVWRGFFGLLDRLAMTMAPRSNVCGLSVRDSRRRGCGRLWHGGGLDERLSTGPSFMFEVSALRSDCAPRLMMFIMVMATQRQAAALGGRSSASLDRGRRARKGAQGGKELAPRPANVGDVLRDCG